MVLLEINVFFDKFLFEIFMGKLVEFEYQSQFLSFWYFYLFELNFFFGEVYDVSDSVCFFFLGFVVKLFCFYLYDVVMNYVYYSILCIM